MKKLIQNILTGVAYIAVGLICILRQGGMINGFLTLLGIYFILAGILDLFDEEERKDGIVNLILGIIILLIGGSFIQYILMGLGLYSIYRGIKFYRKADESTLKEIVSALTIIAGVMLVASHWIRFGSFLYPILGVVVIINGIMYIFGQKN